jgi:hypothetical protein
VLANQARHSNRPGGDRDGWNVRFNWQWQRGPHQFSSQLGYASLQDQASYSILLANGAVRSVASHYLNLRYKRTLQNGIGLLVNLSHQQQRSNLQPFQNRGTVAEVGLAIDF